MLYPKSISYKTIDCKSTHVSANLFLVGGESVQRATCRMEREHSGRANGNVFMQKKHQKLSPEHNKKFLKSGENISFCSIFMQTCTQ
jgi:hypothetical protein